MTNPGGATPEIGLEADIWTFVVPFYGRLGVSQACLTLQDALSLDVNLLLLSLFALLERGIVLDEAEIADAHALVAAWQDTVVKDLRRLRTLLKSGPPPASGPMTAAFRESVKALELRAEQIEVAILGDWLDRLQTAPRRTDGGPADALAHITRHFAHDHPERLTTPAVKAALGVLIEAAAGYRAEHSRT